MILNDVAAFHSFLAKKPNPRILALCGAGLSASSGLPTFRGAGGLWRNHDATQLARPDAFAADPALVWLFYAYRRHMALEVKPNGGHYALAELARKRENFLCLTQNVDNLSQRANHPPDQLRTLHGNLFTLKCTEHRCGYVEHNNFADPLTPGLAPASEPVSDPSKPLPLLDPDVPVPKITHSELPRCPSCQRLTRPGVVWFGESLDHTMLSGIKSWIEKDSIDLMFVIGTSSEVFPAAAYLAEAEEMGATACFINIWIDKGGLKDTDFVFEGDAAEILPKLLEPIIGTMKEDGTFEQPSS